VVGIFLFTYLLFLIPWVQNKVAHKIVNSFSATLGTPVEVGQVRFSLFDKIDIQGVLIRDEHKDTLAYLKSLKLISILSSYYIKLVQTMIIRNLFISSKSHKPTII